MDPLTVIVVAPLVAAGVIAMIPGNYRFLIRLIALLSTLLSMLVSAHVFVEFEPGMSELQFERKTVLIESLGIGYHVGLDGVNVGLVLMGAVVAFAAASISREITDRQKTFYVLLLIMTGGILGAFVSWDVVTFYFFHELALVPTFMMIGIWGRGDSRSYAAFKITLYLSIGAMLVLVGLLALYAHAGAHTFDIVDLQRQLERAPISKQTQLWIFPLLMFGFGVLVSLWPFHTWAPTAYATAPTAVAMMHAGVIKKFGLLGLIRIALPFLPDGARMWLPMLGWLALGNLLYGGWVAMRQKNLNRLLAYSSIAHVGFAFLGLAAFNVTGVTGTVVVMIAHGFLAGLSFALSGYMRRVTGTDEMDRLSGLLQRLPFIGGLLTMAILAGCGVPGFANFAGEILVFVGTWATNKLWVIVAVWASLVVGALFGLRAVRAVLHGPLRGGLESASDPIGPWHKSAYAILVGFLLLFGVLPAVLTTRIGPTVWHLVETDRDRSPVVRTPSRHWAGNGPILFSEQQVKAR